MKRIVSIITTLALCLSLLPGTAWAMEKAIEGNWTDGLIESPTGWSESEDGETITITTPEALAWLAVLVNDENLTKFEDNPTRGKTVILGADLDLSGKKWVPIGNGKSGKQTVNAFVGNFDGNGHTISNVTIDIDNEDSIGLFGNIYLNDSGSIQNVTVENAAITTNHFTGSGYIGVLAGQVIGSGTISDCTVSGTIHCRQACRNTYAGGMFGFLNPTTGPVDRVYLTADRCFADVEITGAPLYAGGFAGYLGSCGKVINCGASGKIAMTDPYNYMPYAGGFIGSFETMNGTVSLESCYATGNVSLTSSSEENMICVGGFLGGIDIPIKTASIQKCMSSGDVIVTASEDIGMVLVGGFIGNGAEDPILTIRNSYATGDVTAANGTYVLCGGFVGYSASTVENCYSLGNVTSQNGGTYSWAFGFSGWTKSGASFTNCYALGERMNGGTHASHFLNGNHSLRNCFYYEEMELDGEILSNQNVAALSKDAITGGTAFSDFDSDIWQLPTGDLPILAGIPDEVEKTDKPVYLSKTVIFDSQGGTPVDSQLVPKNGKVTKPADPTRANYTFGGWYTDADCTTAWDFASDTVAEQMTLYAKWEVITYTVIFDSQSGSAVDSQTIESGGTAAEPAAPTRTGHTFGGWYTDAACTNAYDFGNAVTEPLTLYAKWTPNQYTVTFHTQGGTDIAPVQADYGTLLTKPANPTKANYTFSGWYTDADYTTAWDFASDTVAKNMTLYAKWEVITYTVSFDSRGGTAVAALQVNHGSPVSKPTAPTKDGFLFDGWYTDEDCHTKYDFDHPITGPLTLYANWLKALPNPPAGEGDAQYQLVMTDGISQLPAGLIGQYESTDALEMAMKLEITKAASGISAENTAVYDVALLVSTDGGTTWVAATKENFPESGLTVTLPYPEGTDSSYAFTVVHMFTTSDFDKTPGTTETPAVTNTPAGIRFTVTGLSPISVGWKKPVSSGGSGGSSGVSTYPIKIEKSEHGKVTADRANAVSGSTITLTVTPDNGYVLDILTVTDSKGNTIQLTGKGSGRHAFTMPGRGVTVTATFAEDKKLCDGGADCPASGFTDLGGVETWYHQAVDYVLQNGLMNGYGHDKFGPDDPLSRAQLTQILFNQASRPVSDSPLPYGDVAEDAWYAQAIRWAASQSVVTGYGNGRFGPNDPVTREQLAVMLWRYSGQPAAAQKELKFADRDKISDYAMEALQWAVEQGIVNGKNDGILDPKGKATRAQAAAMLMRFFTTKQ